MPAPPPVRCPPSPLPGSSWDSVFCAAGLKAHGLWTDTAEPNPILTSSRAEVAAIEVEAVLGLWLLSAIYPRASRQVAILFFGLLACASVYLALAGQTSCGCFGRVTVNPWITLALDVAAAASLYLLPTPGASLSHSPAWLQFLGRTCLKPAAILLVVGAVFLLAVDDPAAAIARLRGDSITVEPAICDFGSGPVGVERVLQVQLTNRTDRPIRIIGGSADCRCVAIHSLPLTLSQRETRAIDVKAMFRGSPGKFRHRFRLFTDDEGHPVVVAHVGGAVTPSEE
jgi:hypothetical protein